MPNLQFSCPACAQTIECEEQHAGLELSCPICQMPVIAPGAPAPAPVPAAAAPKKGRLSVSAAPHPPHTAAAPAPMQQPYVAPAKKKKPIDKGPIIKVAAAVVLIPVIIYFSWPYIQKAQEKFSAKVDSASADSGGGQLGHLAELNSVLDATEPSKHETFSENSPFAPGAEQDQDTPEAQPTAPIPKPSANLPSIAPTYTLSAEEAQIPNSKLNGTVAGNEFLPDLVRFDRSGQNYVLTLRQGTNGMPDRELFIYLRAKSGNFETNNLLIAKEFKTGNPQIIKKWKTGPKLFGQKTFSAGYVMRLEFDKISGGTFPGRIYLALPDPEKTVVAGHFTAETSLDNPTY